MRNVLIAFVNMHIISYKFASKCIKGIFVTKYVISVSNYVLENLQLFLLCSYASFSVNMGMHYTCEEKVIYSYEGEFLCSLKPPDRR